MAELTETRPMGFFKAFLYSFVLYTLFSMIFVTFFWMIAPIPSSVYPWTLIQWPIQAVAGLAAGMGIVVGILATFALMFKTTWIKPY